MSKERELLKRAKLLMECSDLIEGTLIESKSPALIKDIEEILSQPEQEPVAWRGVNFTEAEGDWLYRDIEDPFTDSNYRSVGEALYLAPPTREPLDVNKVLMSGTGNGFEYIDGFTDGVLRAEKYHGIGL